MELKGKVTKVLPITTGTKQDGGTWRRMDFIFEYKENENDRWADHILLNIMNERISEYDLYEGDECLIGVGMSVTEYKGKYYNRPSVYSCKKFASAPVAERKRTLRPGVPEPTVVGTEGAEKTESAEMLTRRMRSEELLASQATEAAEDDLPF